MLESQPADCLCFSPPSSNGDVPMSLITDFTLCLKDRFGLDGITAAGFSCEYVVDSEKVLAA